MSGIRFPVVFWKYLAELSDGNKTASSFLIRHSGSSDLALSSPVPEAVNGHAAPHSC